MRALQEWDTWERSLFERGDADAIFEYVKEMKHVSFAELERVFPQFFGGNGVIELVAAKNIFIWYGFSSQGTDVFLNLLRTKRLYPHPCRDFLGNGLSLVYLVDGKLLSMPIARRAIQYKKPHWLPVVLNTFPIQQGKKVAKKWK